MSSQDAATLAQNAKGDRQTDNLLFTQEDSAEVL